MPGPCVLTRAKYFPVRPSYSVSKYISFTKRKCTGEELLWSRFSQLGNVELHTQIRCSWGPRNFCNRGFEINVKGSLSVLTVVHFLFRFILRNYIAQNAIEAAENGDFTVVRRSWNSSVSSLMLPEVFLETTYIVILCVVEYSVSWFCLRMKKIIKKEITK